MAWEKHRAQPVMALVLIYVRTLALVVVIALVLAHAKADVRTHVKDVVTEVAIGRQATIDVSISNLKC